MNRKDFLAFGHLVIAAAISFTEEDLRVLENFHNTKITKGHPLYKKFLPFLDDAKKLSEDYDPSFNSHGEYN